MNVFLTKLTNLFPTVLMNLPNLTFSRISPLKFAMFGSSSKFIFVYKTSSPQRWSQNIKPRWSSIPARRKPNIFCSWVYGRYIFREPLTAQVFEVLYQWNNVNSKYLNLYCISARIFRFVAMICPASFKTAFILSKV